MITESPSKTVLLDHKPVDRALICLNYPEKFSQLPLRGYNYYKLLLLINI